VTGRASNTEYQWRLPAEMLHRDHWHRPHFKCLAHFRVWCQQDEGAVFSANTGPILQFGGNLLVLGSTTAQVVLIKKLTAAVSTDDFLSSVMKSVKDSDDNFSRDSFLDATGVLCYQRAEDVRARVCVPNTCWEAVLRLAHGDSVLSGHLGIDHTYAAIAYAYYWTGIANDISHFVHSCTVCAAAKSSNQLHLGTEFFLAVPLQPFTSWAMDLIGPLPPTKKGHKWIETWVDPSSKMILAADAAADGQMTAEKLALLTFKEICCQFGLPLNLTRDNDVNFVSSLWQSLCHLCGIKLCFTSSYNPQSDLAKRANHQVLEALRVVVATVVQYDEWDEALPYVMFGPNTHVSTATNVSPLRMFSWHAFPSLWTCQIPPLQHTINQL